MPLLLSPLISFPLTPIPASRLFSSSCRLRPLLAVAVAGGTSTSSAAAAADTLRLLEWGRVCDAVADFAGTALGRDATKEQLWEVDVSYEASKMLLQETAAAVELLNFGSSAIDFAGLDTVLVKSALNRVYRGYLVDGKEAIAIVSLIQFVESLQKTVKTATKENVDLHARIAPLAETILDAVISESFVKSALQVIDDDGSIKDSASSELRRCRDQVDALERKLYQLMEKFTGSDQNKTSLSEICIVNGRCCIKVVGIQSPTFDGLLLSSGSGVGNTIEPIAAVPLNDELQQAKLLVAKAEEAVLSNLTEKMFDEIDNIQNLLQRVIMLDKVTARAKYSASYDGTFPDLYLPHDKDQTANLYVDESGGITSSAHHSHIPWKLQMPKAYHPLLLQQHREDLNRARKNFISATAEMRTRSIYGYNIYGYNITEEDGLMSDVEVMKLKVAQLEKNSPVPVDFMISGKTNVVVITGPNAGGKTISLKTVGLASLMAKTGLYVLASEPVEIPWFDAVYADIGDEQSLTQSLSTFSAHLKQIGAIHKRSTSKSLVLLDEVGAGTNPLEGAALGMSILESFAESGSFLTLATSHHGELKTLKYSNSAFENACMEFDEENLKPTFRILWGVPGRSNAVNIADRLGLPHAITKSARELHGTASAEINKIIVDMEAFKQDYQKCLQEAQHYLMLTKELHSSLEETQQKIVDHVSNQRNRKARAVSEYADIARSILRKKMQQFRESAIAKLTSANGSANSGKTETSELKPTGRPQERTKKTGLKKSTAGTEKRTLKVGDVVYVSTLKREATVAQIDASRGEVIVQAGMMKLRIKIEDIKIQ